jgi:lipoprotein
MRREKGMALLLLSVSLLLFAGCGQKKSKEATNSAVPGTASVSEESAATGTAAEAEETLSGVVLEASMNGFTLQNKDRGLVYIATGEDAAEKPDLTRLANGIVPGEGVRLLGKTEDGTFQLSAAADEATALGDKDALYTVGQALLAVRDKNPDALAVMATYPLYLGLASGNEVDNKDELLQKYTAEQIFTDAFCESVLHTDLLTLTAADGNLVVSADGGRPNMIFTKTDAGYKLSAVNVTK